MNSRRQMISTTVSLFSLIGAVWAEIPQAQISITKGSLNTWNSAWTGVTQRTYFFQWSLDLATWHYAPVVDFGTGIKSWVSNASTLSGAPCPKYFVRLKYVDAPWVSTLSEARIADFDGDGIPNAYEVEVLGTNPLDKTSNGGDSDNNGLSDGWEKYYFGQIGIGNPNAIASADGLTNKEKCDLGLNPTINYTSLTSTAQTKYVYNDSGRLTNVTAPVGAGSFTPDAEGNLTHSE
jgi:hypothetical protein